VECYPWSMFHRSLRDKPVQAHPVATSANVTITVANARFSKLRFMSIVLVPFDGSGGCKSLAHDSMSDRHWYVAQLPAISAILRDKRRTQGQ